MEIKKTVEIVESVIYDLLSLQENMKNHFNSDSILYSLTGMRIKIYVLEEFAIVGYRLQNYKSRIILENSKTLKFIQENSKDRKPCTRSETNQSQSIKQALHDHKNRLRRRVKFIQTIN